MGICAFCGRDRELSKEHVWPDWLIDEFPPLEPEARSVRLLGKIEGKDVAAIREREEGPEKVPSVVKVVCRSRKRGDDGCNDGWMSELENEVKPVIVPLAHGEAFSLTTEQRRLLAFWTAKTMVMVEYTDPATKATPVEAQRFLYEWRQQRLVFRNVRVYIGMAADFLPRGYLHYRIVGNPVGVQAIDSQPILLGQQTTFTIGHLVLSIFSTSHPPLEVDPSGVMHTLGLDKHLRSLVPERGITRYPPGPPLDAEKLLVLESLMAAASADHLDLRTLQPVSPPE